MVAALAHSRVQRWSCHLCTCERNCKWLATRLAATIGRYFPGFDTCRSSIRPWRASVQEISASGECHTRDRRAPQGAPSRRPSSVWCATPNGKQMSTADLQPLRSFRSAVGSWCKPCIPPADCHDLSRALPQCGHRSPTRCSPIFPQFSDLPVLRLWRAKCVIRLRCIDG
jgi:hypothetical protein